MTGYGENTGLIPRTCNEIFDRIDKRNADPAVKIEHEIQVSMIEIYNEKI
jgi:kinesin family protein 1